MSRRPTPPHGVKVDPAPRGAPITRLRVVFWNTHGLSETTRRLIFSRLHARQVDVFVACETWGMHRGRHSDGLDAMLLAETPPTPRSNGESGRESGGLAVFVHPDLHGSLECTHVTLNAITIARGLNALSVVYLPPAMSDDAVARELNQLPLSTLVVGDLNCRFSGVNGATANTPRGRSRAISGWRAASSMRIRKTETPVSQIDHLLSRTTAEASHPPDLRHVTPQDMGSHSDHPALLFDWAFDLGASLRVTAAKRPNICLHHLRNWKVAQQLGKAFDGVFDMVEHLFEDELLMGHGSEAAAQKAIDDATACLTDLVDTVAAAVLGEYDILEIRGTRDKTFERLKTTRTKSALSRAFKRMQRNGPKAWVHSRGDESSPEDDVRGHFEALFAPPAEAELPPNPPFEPVPTNQLPSQILQTTSPGAITSWMSRYPKAKSAGPDRVHARVLDALTTWSLVFPNVLCRLFRAAIRTGLTPRCWNISRINLLPKTPTQGLYMNSGPSRLQPCFDAASKAFG